VTLSDLVKYSMTLSIARWYGRNRNWK